MNFTNWICCEPELTVEGVVGEIYGRTRAGGFPPYFQSVPTCSSSFSVVASCNVTPPLFCSMLAKPQSGATLYLDLKRRTPSSQQPFGWQQVLHSSASEAESIIIYANELCVVYTFRFASLTIGLHLLQNPDESTKWDWREGGRLTFGTNPRKSFKSCTCPQIGKLKRLKKMQTKVAIVTSKLL